jgi:hypothetical protein
MEKDITTQEPPPRPDLGTMVDIVGESLLGRVRNGERQTQPLESHMVAAALHELARWYSYEYNECAYCGHPAENHRGVFYTPALLGQLGKCGAKVPHSPLGPNCPCIAFTASR